MMQNQGGSVVLGARAAGVDLLNAAARQGRKLLNDCAVDKDAEAASAHGAMLQRPAIDHNLTRLVCRGLDCGGERHLVARPGHVEVGHILDSERDSYEDVRTLQSHPVDGIMNGLAEEVRFVRWMWRLCATQSQCVRQR